MNLKIIKVAYALTQLKSDFIYYQNILKYYLLEEIKYFNIKLIN